MFTEKHKDLISQFEQHSNSCYNGFYVECIEPCYPFYIKNLNFPESLIYLGSDFILIELFWRDHPWAGKSEVCKIIYSLLTLIAYECDTTFSNHDNPSVNIKSIYINNFIMDIKTFENKQNIYSIKINYEDLNKHPILHELSQYIMTIRTQ